MNNTVIKADNIIKNFYLGPTTVEVLKGISLEITQGDFLSIMGPSGSGKSTLLYLLGGLDTPTSGEITVLGRTLSGMNDTRTSIMRRRDVGFVFQFYNLVPNLNVEDNILLPALLDGKKMKDCSEQLESILDIVELTDRRHHTPRELSGGQQQRVAIARSLMNDPEIILADEPTGNLDSKTGQEVLALLKSISQNRGKTIVMVTHSREAASYTHKTIQVKDGRLC
ncbi:MAG: ABC transporter ATP-binding protein [Spirochaetales bacterium]|nr:ABC transporter ATP-binding protein [Spirochaetales bacterium]